MPAPIASSCPRREPIRCVTRSRTSTSSGPRATAGTPTFCCATVSRRSRKCSLSSAAVPCDNMPMPLAILNSPAPVVSLVHLDELWFQVAGTLCNLECRHCFISCSPHNHDFGFLDLETVRRKLEESVRLGVKEYYFTGGEPFLNREMVDILELTLQYGP